MSTTRLPERLRSLDPARIVDLDVRDDLRNGREPFSRIMEARRALPSDGVLRLRAIFEPFPLYKVMSAQGLEHWTEQLADDDWRVWFYAPGQDAPERDAAASPGAAPAAGTEAGALPEGAIVLDVRGLEPPDPMVRTLEAIEKLPPDTTLVQINERIPRFLFPQLEERGFRYEVRQQGPDLVRVFIQRSQTTDE